MCMASRWPKLPCNTQFQNWRQQAASIIPRSGTLKGIEPNWPLASRIVVLRDHDALTHLSEFQQEQIVYVAHPIQIVYRNPAHEVGQQTRQPHGFLHCPPIMQQLACCDAACCDRRASTTGSTPARRCRTGTLRIWPRMTLLGTLNNTAYACMRGQSAGASCYHVDCSWT